MSSIGWIDFSSEHRDRLRTVLDMLSVPGVLDELGIGPVRDAFADRLFPGISTIQTRAKYFTLTAYLLKKYMETKRSPSAAKLERYLEEEEKRCRIRLVEARGENGTEIGIIGGSFGVDNRRDVMRKPSSIYWNGLRIFGMVKPRDLALAEFSHRLADPKWHLRTLLKDSGENRGDDLDAEDLSGRPRITAPDVPKDYLENLSIELLQEEAHFLRQQIIATQSESLLGEILSNDANMAEVTALKQATFEDFSDLPFIEQLANMELRRTVQHARDFWIIMEGAHIRYNCILQARLGTAERRAVFDDLWTDWRKRTQPFPPKWDTTFMWQLVSSFGGSVGERTREFIEAWIDATRRGTPDLKDCDELVIGQEQFNKGPKARLRPNNTETVGPKWVGIRELDYRQTQVRRLVRDIRDGLDRTGGRDA